MILKTLKKSFNHLKRGLPKKPLRLTSTISKKEKTRPLTGDDISTDKSIVDPNNLEQHIHTFNYNLEENTEYKQNVQAAVEKRNMIKELRSRPEVRRMEKYKYDRPKYDTDISNYSVWREFSDSIMTKEYPHELPVLIKIEAAPKDMVHVFGDSVINSRNDNYSTKEWDFVDSNLDRFLVYDYKATTQYWGPNMPDEWYEVIFS